MKYINKKPELTKGHKITDDYLNRFCLVNDGNGNYHYQNIDYDGSFSSSGAKKAMMKLVLTNQDNLCCYCMRDLNEQNLHVTLEHIIPQSISSTGFNNYMNLRVPPLTSKNIIHTDNFTGVKNIKVNKRPHTVTCENIVASCDGTFPDKDGSSQCCNNRRGNSDVYPMFYITNIRNEIDFTEDGTIQPNNKCTHLNEYRYTIDNTKLNCQNLKDIRRLWHLFKNEDYQELKSCLNDKNKRTKILYSVLFKKVEMMEQDANIAAKYMNENYWRTFLLYRWFHHKI